MHSCYVYILLHVAAAISIFLRKVSRHDSDSASNSQAQTRISGNQSDNGSKASRRTKSWRSSKQSEASSVKSSVGTRAFFELQNEVHKLGMKTIYSAKQLSETVARIKKPRPEMIQLIGALKSIGTDLNYFGEFDDTDALKNGVNETVEAQTGEEASETSVEIQTEEAASPQIDKIQLRRDNLDAQWGVFVESLQTDAKLAIQEEATGALVVSLRDIIHDACRAADGEETDDCLRARAMIRNIFKFLCVQIPRSSKISFAQFTIQTKFVRALSQVCSDDAWTNESSIDSKTVRRGLAIHYEAIELIVLSISAIDADITLSTKLRIVLGCVIEFGLNLLKGTQRQVQDQFRKRFSAAYRKKNSELSSSRFLDGLCEILSNLQDEWSLDSQKTDLHDFTNPIRLGSMVLELVQRICDANNTNMKNFFGKHAIARENPLDRITTIFVSYLEVNILARYLSHSLYTYRSDSFSFKWDRTRRTNDTDETDGSRGGHARSLIRWHKYTQGIVTKQIQHFKLLMNFLRTIGGANPDLYSFVHSVL
eukprot:SAG31_NODE_1856_length_7063_cov_3.328403_5_plen_538_part_00